MKTLREKMLQEMQRRNYSPRTINSYLSSIAGLSRHYHQSPDEISPDRFKDYLHHCITLEGCSNSLVNQAISAYKILHKDVLQRDWSTIRIARPRKEKRLPVVLSMQEAKALVNAAANLKHRSILSVGYSSGLRISEVINLKVNDIDSKRMQIRVAQGKGKKDRSTILSQTTLELLRSYYSVYRPEKWLFEGQGPVSRAYSRESINKIVKRAALKAGINKRVSFHTLRHCFATHLLERGTSLQIIQHLLGHAQIRTTSTYLHVQQYSLDKVVSPMDFEG